MTSQNPGRMADKCIDTGYVWLMAKVRPHYLTRFVMSGYNG